MKMRIATHENNQLHAAFSLENEVVGFSQKAGYPGDKVLLTKKHGKYTVAFAIGLLDYRADEIQYPSEHPYDVWKLRDFVQFNQPIRIDRLMSNYLGNRKFGLIRRSPRVSVTDEDVIQLIDMMVFYDQQKVTA